MIYELRWRDGTSRRLGPDDTLTDAESEALLNGEGRLISIAEDGTETVVVDGGITLLIRIEEATAADGPATPLRAILILRGDKFAWWSGRRFDSVEAFDAVVKLHRAGRFQELRVTLLLEWADGSSLIVSLNPSTETLGDLLQRMLLSTLLNPPPPRKPR